MRNFKGSIFIWTVTYREIFKSALVYLWKLFCHQKTNEKADKLCMKFSSTSNIVHDLEPRYRFLLTSGYLLSGKSIMSCPNQWLLTKIDVFYWSEWIKVMNLKMNFKHFEIQKWMSQAGRAEKSRRKNGVIFVVFMFLSWLMILKLSKKSIFFNFVLTSARNI